MWLCPGPTASPWGAGSRATKEAALAMQELRPNNPQPEEVAAESLATVGGQRTGPGRPSPRAHGAGMGGSGPRLAAPASRSTLDKRIRLSRGSVSGPQQLPSERVKSTSSFTSPVSPGAEMIVPALGGTSVCLSVLLRAPESGGCSPHYKPAEAAAPTAPGRRCRTRETEAQPGLGPREAGSGVQWRTWIGSAGRAYQIWTALRGTRSRRGEEGAMCLWQDKAAGEK